MSNTEFVPDDKYTKYKEWSKKKLLEQLKRDKESITDYHNSMGCSENWYEPYYAVANIFPMSDLEKMPRKHIIDLITLASELGENLY